MHLLSIENIFPKMEKKLKVLSHFDDKYKGVAFNEFLYYIRSGRLEAEGLIQFLQRKLEGQKQYGALQNTNAQWDKYFRTVNKETQLEEFYEALKYAEEWEKKTPFEKDIIKADQREFFGKQSMKGKEPTEKQITFLKSKGIDPDLYDRYECSNIIDKIIKI